MFSNVSVLSVRLLGLCSPVCLLDNEYAFASLPFCDSCSCTLSWGCLRGPCSVHWTHSVFLASTSHFFIYFLLAEPTGWPLVPPFVLTRLLHFWNRQVWLSIRRVPMIWPLCAIIFFLLYSIGLTEPYDFCFTEPTGLASLCHLSCPHDPASRCHHDQVTFAPMTHRFGP